MDKIAEMTTQERRYMAVDVSPHRLTEMLFCKDVYKIESKYPKDAKLVSAYFDDRRQTIVLIVSHKNFSLVLEGCPIPFMDWDAIEITKL